MGGRAKAKGRGGGRGGGGGGRGRGRSAHGSGGRFGWGGGGGGGGRGSSSNRGDGLYGAEDAGDFVALKGAAPGTFFPGYGGGPKRKHRQMHQAYAHAEGGGRRVRKPDVLGDSDSETTSEEQDGDVDGGALDVDHSDDSLGDSDPDPNVERNSVMRIGGIEIRMDRPGGGGGSNARRERFPPRPPARRHHNLQFDAGVDICGATSTEDEDDREGSEWGSELSLDSDAIDDYMRNCMDDDTDTEEDEDADDASFDEGRAADAAVAAAEEAWEKSERDGFDVNDANAREARRAAREERYLRRMRDMNLDGKEVPSPAVTDDDESDEGSSDSDDSEAENEALKSGDYGTYRWGKGALKKKGRGSLAGSSGGLPVSGKRAAKKAAKKAFKRGDSPEDFGLRRPRAVAETLAGMIRSGGAYIGFQSGMSDDALRGLLGIAHAMGLKAELRGGGKRRHAVVHWAHGARVPRDGDERLERAIASAEGEPYEGGGGGGGGGGVRGAFGNKRNGSAPNFVSAGVMQNDDEAVTEGADDAMEQNKGDAFTAVDADLLAEYEEVKKASFDRTDSHDLYSKYIPMIVEELQEHLTRHEETVSFLPNLPDGGQRLKDRIQLLKELIPIKEREYKAEVELMMGTVDAAEVEAELAAADADMRAAETFLNAPEAGTDGDGDGDDAEEIQRSNRGLRRAALAAERELRASQAQRRKKGGDGKVVGAGHEFGAFEAHTSGFGSRMLAKMGFQGEGSGVGKDGSGISEPITASMRAKRVGLGAER